MKRLKYFKESSSNDFKIGDMVYVDAYGPSTYGYSTGAWDVKRKRPFRPKIYNLDPNTKYEIVFIEHNNCFFYDESNQLISVPMSKISKESSFGGSGELLDR